MTLTLSRPVIKSFPSVTASLLALALSSATPLLGPLLIALMIGALVANIKILSTALPTGHEGASKFLLRLGIVLLGLRLPIQEIAGVGVHGLVVVLGTVIPTYWFTQWAGKRLQLDSQLVTLIASGFAICGAAAIAAVADAIKARDKEVAISLALVTVFGSIMIPTIPWASGHMGLSDEQAAMWAGASIHEVAQVAAAAAVLGSSSVGIAITVKLGRVVLLAPVYGLAARSAGSTSSLRIPIVPWFVLGFIICIGVRASGVLGSGWLNHADNATTLLLAAGMFGLGAGCRLGDLWPLPIRAFTLAMLSTITAAIMALGLVLLWSG